MTERPGVPAPTQVWRRFAATGALLAGLCGSPAALAHAILVKATPDKEAVVPEAPHEVLLVFNDAVGEEFLALAVIDETGKRVDKHDARLDLTDHSHLGQRSRSSWRAATS